MVVVGAGDQKQELVTSFNLVLNYRNNIGTRDNSGRHWAVSKQTTVTMGDIRAIW